MNSGCRCQANDQPHLSIYYDTKIQKTSFANQIKQGNAVKNCKGLNMHLINIIIGVFFLINLVSYFIAIYDKYRMQYIVMNAYIGNVIVYM